MRRHFTHETPNGTGGRNHRRGTRGPARRRGGVTLWTLIALPAILTLFCFVVEMAHLWHAKVKLKNAVESGVLAAARNWGDNGGGGGGVLTAANVGEDYAEANSIDGVSVTDVDPGDFIFGSVTPHPTDTSYVFTSGDPHERNARGAAPKNRYRQQLLSAGDRNQHCRLQRIGRRRRPL